MLAKYLEKGLKLQKQKSERSEVDEAMVVWNFDGQVRHRIWDEEIRAGKTIVDLKRRREAVGKVTDFQQDHVITYLTEHAEEIFEPKRILTGGDWLKSYREPD